MIFKSINEIKEAFFGREEHSPMAFDYQGCTVVFKSNSNKKTPHDKGKRSVICETTLRQKANDKIKSIFGEMAEGVYKDSEKADSLISELKSKMDKGEISGYNLPFDILPDRMQDYLNNVSDELHSYASRTYRSLRWYSGLEGSVNPFSNKKKSWSFDGNDWHHFPSTYSIELSVKAGIRDSEELQETVKSIVEMGNSEPLANELYLEALSLKNTYPRSALLIAIAAAETGVKQFIVNIHPDTKWIIENMPSPDILKLLREYIPKLPVKNKIQEEIEFPKTVMKPLKKGIQMRNIVAHGGNCSLTTENLKVTLKSVRQLLWLLDYYSGYDWALKHLNQEVNDELNLN